VNQARLVHHDQLLKAPVNTEGMERKRPVWGIISVLAVPAGFLIIAAGGTLLIYLAHAPTDTAGWAFVFLSVIFVPGSMLFGVIAALVSWVRFEKHPWLPLLGLLVSLSPLIWLLLAKRH
jgi:hypothetical protein